MIYEIRLKHKTYTKTWYLKSEKDYTYEELDALMCKIFDNLELPPFTSTCEVDEGYQKIINRMVENHGFVKAKSTNEAMDFLIPIFLME